MSSVLAIVSGLSLSPLFVQLMLTHDEQQQPLVAVSSQNSYEQYIQNYAAQQVDDDDDGDHTISTYKTMLHSKYA